MSHSSDSESSEDSDKGVRYKTDSIRNKTKKNDSATKSESHRRKTHSRRRSYNSSSDENNRKRKKEKKYEKETRNVKSMKSAEVSGTSKNLSNVSIGPILPPHMTREPQVENFDTNTRKETQKELSQDKECKDYGPDLPSQLLKKSSDSTEGVIGPALPPHLIKKSLDNTDKDNSNVTEKRQTQILGPALPPHLQKKIDRDYEQISTKESLPIQNSNEEERVIGPSLPPHMRQQLAEQSDIPNVKYESEEEAYGPLPIGAALSKSHLELEERAWQLKIDQLNPNGDQDPKREEWMLELPEVKASNLGLGPRTFRMKGGPDMSNRSSWTDTPQDKALKKDKVDEVDLQKEAEMMASRKRDQDQEEQVKKCKRSNDSLLEIHRKKLKSKKKDDEPMERRPFSRDIDLQVNKFDDAQKKAVLKKAQLLDDRFSSGQAKFL